MQERSFQSRLLSAPIPMCPVHVAVASQGMYRWSQHVRFVDDSWPVTKTLADEGRLDPR